MNSDIPAKLQAIILMQLITGILIILGWGSAIVGSCGVALVAIVPIYGLAEGAVAVVSGAKGLSSTPRHNLYRTAAIMQIIGIIAGDLPGTVSGILTLIFLKEPEVQEYLEGGGSDSQQTEPSDQTESQEQQTESGAQESESSEETGSDQQ